MRLKYLGCIVLFSMVAVISFACMGSRSAAPPLPLTQPAAATQLTATPSGNQTEPLPQPANLTASLKEKRLLVIEWPYTIRVGDADVVRLSLEMDKSGNVTPTAKIGGHQVTGETVEIPDIYETHNLVAEVRFDLVGMDISPQGTVSEPIEPGQKVEFFWSLSPRQTGIYRGILWLYLNIVPKEGGFAIRQTLLARPVEIEASSVLGLPANIARGAGLVGTALSSVLGVPFLESGIKKLWELVRKKKRGRQELPS